MKNSEKRKRSLADPEGPVILVSSNYHMKRAMQTAERTGFKKIYRLPAPSDPFTFGSNVMWEVMSLLKSYR
ncbi:MAG: YdcF family protein [Firmicutes bacterium]|nr:YdcF family protein [Bacillota bacterium]